LDPRLGTELGRLALHDELTSAEVSAGFRIAEIYQAFEHFHGRTRSAAGSSFLRQFVADLEKPIRAALGGLCGSCVCGRVPTRRVFDRAGDSVFAKTRYWSRHAPVSVVSQAPAELLAKFALTPDGRKLGKPLG
jgi:hypothetical protein